MKKFFSVLGIILLVCFGVFYIYFLNFLPKQIDLNEYKPLIQKMVLDYSGLNIDFQNPEIITTPKLEAGVQFDSLTVSLPDNTSLFSLPYFRAKLSLLNLLVLNVKLSEVLICKPALNLEITKNDEINLIKIVEGKLNELEKGKNLSEISKKEEQNKFDITSLIRINAPNIKIFNYTVAIKDDKTKDYLLLNGNVAKAAFVNSKRVKFKTKANLFLNKEKQLSFDVDVNSIIPKQEELDVEDDPNVRSEIPFVNPVLMYKKYGLKGDIKTKIKLDEKGEKIIPRGFFDMENITLDIDGYRIPKSYFKIKTQKRKTLVDLDFYIAKDQNLSLGGLFKHKKYPDCDFRIYSNGIYFKDLLLFTNAITNSLGLQGVVPALSGSGVFEADAKVKIKPGNLKSEGAIIVKDGAIVNSKTGFGIKDIKSVISFDDNILDIKNTSLGINDGKIKINGKIDGKSNADINLSSDNLPIKPLFEAFAPNDIKKEILFNDGKLFLTSEVKGKIKKPTGSFEAQIKDINFSDKLKTYIISNDNLKFEVNNKEGLSANIQNKGFKIDFPYSKSSIRNDSIKAALDEKNFKLDLAQIKLNDKSQIVLSGNIEDYIKNPKIAFNMDGNLFAEEIKKFLGNMAEPFVDAKGIIPIKGTFTGNKKKQTFRMQIAADGSDYITFMNIKPLKNFQSIMQVFVDFKGNRVKIKDTGLYMKVIASEFTNDFDLNMADTNKIAAVEGTITNISSLPTINLFKIDVPKPLEIDLFGFKESNFVMDLNLALFGNLSTPRTKGHLTVSNLKLPDAKLTMDEAKVLFNGKEADISTSNLLIDKSDIEFKSKWNLEYFPLIFLDKMSLTSNLMDTDGLIEISDNIMKMIPKDPVERPQGDIPARIKDGVFDIKNLISGNIVLSDTKGEIDLSKNILAINNLETNAFDGEIEGKVDVNLLTLLINADIKGKNLDSNKALIALAQMKDTIEGALDFETNVSLSGTTFEQQVQSLDGYFDFTIKDGVLGPFSKIENIFLSENLRESEFFQTAIGSMVNSAVSIDTAHFDELKGHITLKDGLANVEPITSKGNALCIKIDGVVDILKNTIDMQVRGRLGSMVASVLGPLANLNPVNIVKATPGLNVVMVKTFSAFCQTASKEEMDAIPNFEGKTQDLNATKFQIILRGDAAKPLSLLKSFKWLVTSEEYESANNFVTSIPDELPEGVSTLEELNAYNEEVARKEAESKTLKGKLKNFFTRNEKI